MLDLWRRVATTINQSSSFYLMTQSVFSRWLPHLISAFELFLTALVKEEMSRMPRGVHFMAMRGGSLASARGKTVAGIPAFMLKTYEKNKQPGLKSGLTGARPHLFIRLFPVLINIVTSTFVSWHATVRFLSPSLLQRGCCFVTSCLCRRIVTADPSIASS